MRYPKCVATLAVVALAAGTACVSPARAQIDITPTYIGTTAQDIGVLDRPRPEYDAKGVPLGSFRLFPSFDLVGNYDDNVFRVPAAQQQSDFFLVIAPQVRLRSDWGRHYLEIYSNLTDFEYEKFNKEGLTDWTVGADGRLDVSRATTVSADLSYGRNHEAWFAPSVVGNQVSPNRYMLTRADVSGTFQPSQLGITLGGSYLRYSWSDTPLVGGGLLLNHARDMSEYRGVASLFYEFSPGYRGFIRATSDTRVFDQSAVSQYRSSHGYHVDGGVDLQITHLVRGEIYAGYLKQSFAHPQPDVAGPDYGIKLDWFATQLITVHIDGTRELDDIVLGTATVADYKTISLSADYEFRHNLIIQPRVYYTSVSYPGLTRRDSYPGVSIGVIYLINRIMSANFNYNYSDRSTNIPTNQYTDNMVSAGLALHL